MPSSLIPVATFRCGRERYDRELKDVFEVQEEIARSIAQALRIKLSAARRANHRSKSRRKMPKLTTTCCAAGTMRGWANFEFAMQMYQHAIRHDPDFALAYAGIAHVCGLLVEFQGGDPLWIKKGILSAERALTLRPDLPEAISARARMHCVQQEYGEAVQLARRAIELKADCEDAYRVLGRALFESDRWKEAVELIDRALATSGDDYNVYLPYANALRSLGETEAATKLDEKLIAVLERQLEIVPEDTARAFSWRYIMRARTRSAEPSRKPKKPSPRAPRTP